jgi:hypothetical protein
MPLVNITKPFLQGLKNDENPQTGYQVSVLNFEPRAPFPKHEAAVLTTQTLPDP